MGLVMLDNRWSMNIPESMDQAGGLVLQNVYQNDHLLSTDIRVTQIMVGTIKGATISADSMILGTDLAPIGGNQPPSQTSFPVSSISSRLAAPYLPAMGLSCSFSGSPTLNKKPLGTLGVRQDFVFTNYGNQHAHEPSGLICAARFLPLMRLTYDQVTSPAQMVNYCRVDYRIETAIEAFALPNQNAPALNSYGQNQAGLFKDQDSVDFYDVLAAANAIASDPYKLLFSRVSKPLDYEILAEGLDWTQPDSRGAWDNIHIWPAQDGLPTTPGAPHAIHLHWRWGQVYGTKQDTTPGRFSMPAAGQSQFIGQTGAGGPLISDDIPTQRMRFAVTLAAPGGVSADVPGTKGQPTKFDQLLRNGNNQQCPKTVTNGGRLVLWISFEAVRNPSLDSWGGTFFPYGLFFAHETTATFPKLQLPWFLGFSTKDHLEDSARTNQSCPSDWWRPGAPNKPEKPPMYKRSGAAP